MRTKDGSSIGGRHSENGHGGDIANTSNVVRY